VYVPEHFEPLAASPFHERIGPLYVDRRGADPIVGVRIEPHHVNSVGIGHGGVLMSLADIALAHAMVEHLPPGASGATADLHIAFLHSVNEGDWVQARPTVDRVGRAVIQGSCVLTTNDQPVAKASATFAVRGGSGVSPG
jgi:uncharacterized protein (TIGR00369 family)